MRFLAASFLIVVLVASEAQHHVSMRLINEVRGYCLSM